MLYLTPYCLFILKLKVCTCWLPTPILPTSTLHSALAITSSYELLCTYELGFYLVLLSGATYKWGYIIFVFFYLTYFKPSTQCPQGSCMLSTVARFPSVRVAEWYACVYSCMYVCITFSLSIHLHFSIDWLL